MEKTDTPSEESSIFKKIAVKKSETETAAK